METGIKTSDEIQSLLTARGHFSRTLSWFGRCPGIDKHLREFNSTAASGGEYQEKIFSCARISPAASEAAFNLLPHSLWALFGFVVSQKFGSAVNLGYI